MGEALLRRLHDRGDGPGVVADEPATLVDIIGHARRLQFFDDIEGLEAQLVPGRPDDEGRREAGADDRGRQFPLFRLHPGFGLLVGLVEEVVTNIFMSGLRLAFALIRRSMSMQPQMSTRAFGFELCMAEPEAGPFEPGGSIAAEPTCMT